MHDLLRHAILDLLRSTGGDIRQVWYRFLNVDHELYSIKYYCEGDLEGDLDVFLEEVFYMMKYVPTFVGFKNLLIFENGRLCTLNLIPWEKEGF